MVLIHASDHELFPASRHLHLQRPRLCRHLPCHHDLHEPRLTPRALHCGLIDCVSCMPRLRCLQTYILRFDTRVRTHGLGFHFTPANAVNCSANMHLVRLKCDFQTRKLSQ